MRSLKAVLLHQTNEKPSIPVAYSTIKDETYDAMKLILERIQYNVHHWKICCDFKVINMLRGMPTPKYYCFICLWDSRYKGMLDQYAKKNWKKRPEGFDPQHSMVRPPLIEPIDNILLPPLHIKLGIVEKFIRNIVNRDEVFAFLKNKFRRSDAKIEKGNIKIFLQVPRGRFGFKKN